jgi:hypothetical protein
MAVLNQNLDRAFDLFELTPATEIRFLDSHKKTLSKCCIDPLRPPAFSETGFLRSDEIPTYRKHRFSGPCLHGTSARNGTSATDPPSKVKSHSTWSANDVEKQIPRKDYCAPTSTSSLEERLR